MAKSRFGTLLDWLPETIKERLRREFSNPPPEVIDEVEPAESLQFDKLVEAYLPLINHSLRSDFKGIYFLDNYWSDRNGVFLNGWVHGGPNPITKIILMCGAEQIETTNFLPRPDVIQHYPDLPSTGAAGFTLYLPCRGYYPLILAIVTSIGVDEIALDLPIVEEATMDDATGAGDRFVESMLSRRGVVLELGARIVGSLTQPWRSRFEPVCQYIGNDIHAGPGIDVVGDVHTLTDHLEARSLDGIFSIAVLEHLAAPWIAAVEINRALKSGGEVFHVTHQTWPVHETPNDFFRMSDQALRSLFGPSTGFEVLECGMAYPVSIYPPPYMRNSAWLWVPVGRGYGQSYIHARKAANAEQFRQSDSDIVLQKLSEAYPR